MSDTESRAEDDPGERFDVAKNFFAQLIGKQPHPEWVGQLATLFYHREEKVRRDVTQAAEDEKNELRKALSGAMNEANSLKAELAVASKGDF